MKKLSLIALAAILFSLSPNLSFGQKEKGQSVITAGAGYSLAGALFKAVYTAADVDYIALPAINSMYDFGLTENFSVGGAFTYQSFSAKLSGVTAYDPNTFAYTYGPVKDTWTRMNFGVRPLFHFGQSEKLDMYSGLRLGYSIWSYKTTRYTNYTAYTDLGDTKAGTFTVQALFGMRAYFTDMIGVNAEFSIGSPYMASLGVSFKL